MFSSFDDMQCACHLLCEMSENTLCFNIQDGACHLHSYCSVNIAVPLLLISSYCVKYSNNLLICSIEMLVRQ